VLGDRFAWRSLPQAVSDVSHGCGAAGGLWFLQRDVAIIANSVSLALLMGILYFSSESGGGSAALRACLWNLWALSFFLHQAWGRSPSVQQQRCNRRVEQEVRG
jgi:hypothetical protein